jgi:very-short-patch-repair endonuclease
MPIPSIRELAVPVLRLLAGGETKSTRVITASLAEEFGLSKDELARRRPDGRPLFQNRIEWARTGLKRKGLVEYPEPCATRITSKGEELLLCDPRELCDELHASPRRADPVQLVLGESENLETLEQELRRLTGPAAVDDSSWEIVRRLNGWGPQQPISYRRLAVETGIDKGRILRLARSCRQPIPEEAPMLDAALRLLIERPERDPDRMALSLISLGITEDAFCMPGLCEAARRFGRFEEWRELIRLLADDSVRTARSRPRPFDSWFEIDVFLYVTDLGHRALPQKRIGNYRVDLLLPDFSPQIVVECDGDRYHDRDRAEADEVRERWLGERGYTLVRFKYSDYKRKSSTIMNGLAEILSTHQGVGVQLRAGW